MENLSRIEQIEETAKKYYFPDKDFSIEKRQVEELLEESKKTLSRETIVVDADTSKILFVGDTHGDIESTKNALLKAVELSVDKVVFLGDYVDRGPYQLGNILFLLEVKNMYPGWVYLLRGNHETRVMNETYGFLRAVTRAYGPGLYNVFEELFSNLSLAFLLNKRILAVHGGIPIRPISIEEIRRIPKGLRDNEIEGNDIVLQMLWNDPDEYIEDYADSPRGPGIYLFGKRIFEEFMSRNSLDLLIRAHEPVESGVKYLFDGRLASVFSCRFYGISPAALLLDGNKRKIVTL
jgi:predicted phosphodiesterase